MAVKTFDCPSCGHPLPAGTRPNEIVTCPACHSTLYLSDWEIGKSEGGIAVSTPTRIYTVLDQIFKDDLCNTYRCAYEANGKEWQGMFRAAINATDNDLVTSEAQTLYHLQSSKDYDDYKPFLPAILESFLYKDATLDQARQVTIVGLDETIHKPTELYTLEEIHKHYPGGIDPRDMAWMWRRLLFILGFVHQSNVIHGAVLPLHVMIEPRDHKLMLNGWGYAVREPKTTGDRLTAISITYEKWYPQEVFNKQTPTSGLDLQMAARCMMYLIGIDPLENIPEHRNLDRKMARYFSQFMTPNPAQRPQDAWKILAEFDELLEDLWGARTFRIFTMPHKI